MQRMFWRKIDTPTSILPHDATNADPDFPHVRPFAERRKEHRRERSIAVDLSDKRAVVRKRRSLLSLVVKRKKSAADLADDDVDPWALPHEQHVDPFVLEHSSSREEDAARSHETHEPFHEPEDVSTIDPFVPVLDRTLQKNKEDVNHDHLAMLAQQFYLPRTKSLDSASSNQTSKSAHDDDSDDDDDDNYQNDDSHDKPRKGGASFSTLTQPADAAPAGLINLGNTCYANSALQCLFYAARPFMRALQQECDFENVPPVTGALLELHERLLESNRQATRSVSPKNFMRLFVRANRQFDNEHQQDAHEFLGSLLETLNDECLGQSDGQDSLVADFFHGQTVDEIECRTCGKTSRRTEPFSVFSLVITSESALVEAFDQTLAPERLREPWNCTRCKQKRKAIKKTSMLRWPRSTLVVHLEKGLYDERNPVKDVFVPDRFDPARLSNGAMLLEDCSSDAEDEGRDAPVYGLRAAVCYASHSSEDQVQDSSGHYTALVKDRKGSWILLDDDRPPKVMRELADVKDRIATSACLVFYTALASRIS